MTDNLDKLHCKLTAEITEYIIDVITNNPDSDIQELDNNYTVYDFFFSPDRMRLKSTGFKFMTILFKSNTFTHSTDFTSSEIIKLSRYIKTPYYINNKDLTVFGAQDMVMLKLNESVSNWVDGLA